MRIHNQTAYATRALRSIICAAHQRLAKHEGRLSSWSRLQIDVVYGRSRGGDRCSGWATLGRRLEADGYLSLGGGGLQLTDHAGGRRMRLRLEKPLDGKGARVRTLATLARHELLHSYGYGHSAFTDDWADPWPELAQLGEFIPVQQPRAKPPRDRAAERFAAAQAAERRWLSRLRRAETALKKVRRRLAYYERKAAGRS